MKKIAYMTPQTRAVTLVQMDVTMALGASGGHPVPTAPRRAQTIRHIPSLSTIPTPKI